MVLQADVRANKDTPPPPPLNKQRGFILAAIVTLIFVAPGAQAQETTDICGRTQQVVDEILRQTSTEDDACDSVFVSEMVKISRLGLNNKGISLLKSGDFDNLPALSSIELQNNDLTELPVRILSDIPVIVSLFLSNNALATFNSDGFVFPYLTFLWLDGNQLGGFPDGYFSAFPVVRSLQLHGNLGAPFRFTVRFEPETLEEDFTAALVRVVLREGAPNVITVPLLVTGGSLVSGAPNSLTIAQGSTQSGTVTVVKGDGYFRLGQGQLEFLLNEHTGYEIVRGPAITVGGVPVRVKVFLEGALE